MSDLIDRKALMDVLGIAMECDDCEKNDAPFCGMGSEFVNACEAIADAPSAESGWIPVTERLPEEEGCYIVSIDPFYCLPVCICIDLLHFIDGKWQCEYEGKMEEWKDPVLAWMPLPEPFKGGDA